MDAVERDSAPDVSLDAARDAAVDALLDVPRDVPADVALDARTDAAPDVARADVPGTDATDASPPDVATPTDVPGTDAALDARADTGAPVDAGTRVHRECVAAVAGNELNSAIVLDANFYVGWRFEVAPGAPMTARRIGLNVETSASPGATIFGALVALSSSSDAPDAADLSGSDVIATTTLTLGPRGVSTTIAGDVDVALPPGWYAVVFGTGRLGATATGASVHSNSGASGCLNGQFPFSLRQRDGMLILQAATPHFFVDTE